MIKFIDKLKENKFLNKILSSEFILYIIVGGLTTLINFIAYWFFTDRLRPKFGDHAYRFAYVIAFIAAILFAYIADKIMVFKSNSYKISDIVKEFFTFVSARLISSGIGFFLTVLTVGLLQKNGIAEPIAEKLGILPSFIFNIVFNYIVAKFVIFNKK